MNNAELLEHLTRAIESAKGRRFIAVSIDLEVAEQLRVLVELLALEPFADGGDGSLPTPDTPITADCWRDLLSVRTLNALLNANLRVAGQVFALNDHDLLLVRNLGPKGVNQIHRARARMLAAVAERSA